MTGDELFWLEAVARLHRKVDREFNRAAEGDDILTSAKLGALAKILQGCSGSLAQIGVPSKRLQPVYALARKGCGYYDSGARCFVAAAKIGVPARAAEDQQLTRYIQCGFAAVGPGSKSLADAEIRGIKIKQGAG
jgi:hypothetical protein